MINIYQVYIVPLSILIPLVISFVNYKFLTDSLKIITFFLVISGVLNLLALFLATHHKPNLIVIHIYTVFEFAFISWFYKLNFRGLISKIIPWLIIVFTILCIINVLFIQKSLEFNTYTRSLEAVIIIGYSIALFSKESTPDNEYRWGSANWINAGILIYFSGCFFTFIFSNYLLTATKTVNHIVWCANDTILLFEYILFAVSFYKCRDQSTISSYW